MKLLLVNPNTSAAMTHGMAEAARAVAAPGTVVVGRQPSFGPVSIESHFDEVFGAAGVAEQVRLAAPEGFDAVVIACFGDPGLDAARELTTAPVLGIAEAAFHAASFVATGFSVVTTMTRILKVRSPLAPIGGDNAVSADVTPTTFSAYGITLEDDPVSLAMKGLIDNASTQEQQIALLWQAIEKLSKNGSGKDCVPVDAALECTFEAARLTQLMGK